MSHVEEGRLHAYLDGELAAEQERRLEEHVEDCGRCESLLEGAIHARAAAGRMLADAEASAAARSAPEWDELVRRAGEAAPEERSEDTGADPERVPSLLVPGLAWAATLVLAFFLGWQSANRLPAGLARSSLPPDARSEPSLAAAEEAPAPGSPEPANEEEAPPLVENREEVAREMAEAGQGLAEAVEPTATTASGPPAAEAAGETLPEGAVADVPAEEARLVEAPERAPERASKPAAGEWTIAERPLRRATIAGAPRASAPDSRADAEGIPETARGIPSSEAEAWLGAPPRRLPGGDVRSVAVAPASLLPGAVPGRPILVTVYDLGDDTAPLTLMQQFVGIQGPAGDRFGVGDGVVPGGSERAELIVRPDGTHGLRWLAPGGYLLLLEGAVTESELRRLARTVE